MTRVLPASILLGGLLAVAAAGSARAQTSGTERIHVLPVQGNVYMLVTPAGNIAVQAGDEGVLLVDSGASEWSDEIVAAFRSLSKKPLRYILNTNADADRVGGNIAIGKQGSAFAGGNMGTTASARAQIIAHENVLNRMSAPTGTTAPTAEDAWPTDTFFTPRKEVFFNGEAIEMLHQPAAHSDGDSIVFFRRSDVLVASDLMRMDLYPVIDVARGGTINGVLDGLNQMLDIAIPKEKQEGGTYIIPAYGRLCDEADLLEYRDMLTIIRDRVKDAVAKGKSLADVKQARPTFDYDGRFGATTGPWTTDMFVEAVYKSLSAAKDKKSE